LLCELKEARKHSVVTCISLAFYLYVVQLGFEQLNTEPLRMGDEVEMRSCDLLKCIYFASRADKKARIPTRLTDRWGSGLTSRRMASESEETWEVIPRVSHHQQVATLLL
jgi:hypothetical protein